MVKLRPVSKWDLWIIVQADIADDRGSSRPAACFMARPAR